MEEILDPSIRSDESEPFISDQSLDCSVHARHVCPRVMPGGDYGATTRMHVVDLLACSGVVRTDH